MSAAILARRLPRRFRAPLVALRSIYRSTVDLTESGEQRPKKDKKRKIRLDEYLIQEYPQHPQMSLKAWIQRRRVLVNGKVIDKAGTVITEGQRVTLEVDEAFFASRAGYKLDAAIQHFGIDVRDKYCLDAGIGTGGFTDCLLQRKARKAIAIPVLFGITLVTVPVYGVDVGYGDVDYRLRIHPRVTLFERTNLRHLDPNLIPHPIDLATLDLSFISVLKVIPVVANLMTSYGEMVVLIKPQFEADREDVNEGGVVDDPEVHQEVIERVQQGIEEEGFECIGVIESPLKGKDSENTEYLSYFRRL